MSWVRRVLVNPSAKEQKYIFWANGLIQPIGGALPVNMEAAPDGPTDLPGSPGSRPSPTWWHWNYNIGATMQVTDWAGPGGYTIDMYGKVYPWGTAAELSGSQPTYQWPNKHVVDAVFDPTGSNGRGYVLLSNGQILKFGTGLSAITGKALKNGQAVRLAMDWTTKKTYILDIYGRIFARNGAALTQIKGLSYGQAGWVYDLARALVVYDWTNGYGWILTAWGQMIPVGASTQSPINKYATPNRPLWSDAYIYDDGTAANPLRLGTVTVNGAVFETVSSTPPDVHVGAPEFTPVDPTTDTTRPTFGWKYADAQGDAQRAWALRVIADGVWDAGGLVNEVQRVTITGAPTGGTFDLEYDGEVAEGIAYNVSAAGLVTALEALPNVETGDIAASGGPLPGTPIDVTFQGRLRKHNWPLMTADASGLTGGTTPAVTPSTITAGTGIDPATAAYVYAASGEEQLERAHTPTQDFVNDTYRVYVRVADTAGQLSSWGVRQWTQNVSALATPTVVATSLDELNGVQVAVNVNPAGFPVDGRLAVQYQDADDLTWRWVRDGWDLDPDGSGDASVVDLEARFGVVRSYRVIPYVADPFRTGPWSATDTATLGPRNIWTLTNPTDDTQGGVIRVVPGPVPTRPIAAGVFSGVGSTVPIVVTDGAPKAARSTYEIYALDAATRTMLKSILESDDVLYLRNMFGEAWYVRPIDEIREGIMHAAPAAGEVTSIRDARVFTVTLQEVARPDATPTIANLDTL